MTAPAQQTLAAVLVAHGDRGGTSPNAALESQAEAVRKLTGLRVFTGVLKGERTIEHALAEAATSGAASIAVYPLFMADGYFVNKVRERIAAAGLASEPKLLIPLGLDPTLSDVLVNEAIATAEQEGFDPSKSRLLVVGHGSKLGPASASATRKAAARAALARRFASVTTAFLEEDPFLDDALRVTSAPTVVAGFFFGNGMHAGEDVPEAIAETGANAIYTGAIGNSPAAAPLIAAALSAAARP
ncbi:CbiX/SirB N-terminal domain-containing protein [Hyphomicrobium sp. LHD-15]|uniref:CbiX/SirB N-terminal domain-containing protein n=1 Tax=Hyphomicrobium sp. LHD-15 TaxID=3072142 RepID=UPI00280DCA5C|nr:CbiX/SirB N-terminal domain-containing protein [Hyphomicrobium sp. LHD-15]MDQ8700818.1 CbiX/SirB N-terminal domain-containing protein [Hyphomicrobium sp. LHD-15]